VDEIPVAIAKAQETVDVFNGPIFAVDVFTGADGDQISFMAAHHLAVDLVSWRIILNDLEELLTGEMVAGRPTSLPFQTWLSLQRDEAQNIRPELALPFTLPTQVLSFWGSLPEANTFGNIVEHGFTLPSGHTSYLLNDCITALSNDVVNILIGTLIHAFSQTFQDRTLPSVFTEGHGRESWDDSVDVSSTVGWFTTMAPVHITADADENVKRFIKMVKDRRRQTPINGWSCFASRFLNTECAEQFGHAGPYSTLLGNTNS
jgi:hypothetical protein